LLRSDHNTHSFTAGDRYVRLSFEASGGAAGDVRVKLPNLMPPVSGVAFR
jgi:hypothetical protein